MKAVLIILLGMLSFGCATIETDIESKPLDRVYLDDIYALIENGEILTAYQDIAFLRREQMDSIPGSELDRLDKQILETAVSQFYDYIERETIGDAYRIYLSLKAIGRSDLLPEWNEPKLLYQRSLQIEAGGNATVAMLMNIAGLRLVESGIELDSTIVGQMLLATLRNSVALGNASLSEEVVELLEERAIEIPEELQLGTFEKPSMESVVRGTVTIWVNRGIRIEQGVGYPDRVIGSGFFIDPRGYLLTNYHVIASEVDPEYEGYSRLYIRLSDNVDEKIPARVVGYDRIFDLALIKAEIESKYVLPVGSDVDLKPGDRIVAIGSPAGLENTVTSGIVSATGRRFLQLGDSIQVDVPINYGNSGGPLLDEAGRLVGVVFAGIEQFEGINFAIPFIWVNKALPRLYEGGEVTYPWLGLALQETAGGLQVVYAVPGEPAARAGIEQGDILLSLNNQPYSRLKDIQSALIDLDYPMLVQVRWQREEETFEGPLTLAERPHSPIDVALERDTRDSVLYPLFGMKIEKTGSYLWQTEYVIRDVLQGSIADESGFSENDPLRVQGWEVDVENRYAVLQLYVKKKKSGFLESIVQLAAYLDTDQFL